MYTPIEHHAHPSSIKYVRRFAIDLVPTRTPITIEAMESMPKPKKRPRPIPHGMITKYVFVEMPTGRFLYWVLAEPFTIEDVKLLIFQKEGIPVQSQRLLLEVPNDRTIWEHVKMNNEITFILMPVYYNCTRALRSYFYSVVMNEEEGDENDERKEEKEQEDANDKEEAKGELSSQDSIGLELFGDEPDT